MLTVFEGKLSQWNVEDLEQLRCQNVRELYRTCVFQRLKIENLTVDNEQFGFKSTQYLAVLMGKGFSLKVKDKVSVV